jgi:hypothetical protein
MTTISFFLLFIIIFSLSSNVKAWNYSLSYAPNRHENGVDDSPYEEQVTNDVVDFIDSLFITYGWHYDANYYTDASLSDFLYGLSLTEYYTNVAFFTKGHILQYDCPGSTTHYGLMMHESDDFLNDTNISDYTNGNIKLAVIWHCGTAQGYTQYGDNYCTYCDNYYTMPMAFTKDNVLSPDGYGDPDWGPYTFLGFHGYSPQFLSNWGLNNPWYYYHFISNIYFLLIWGAYPYTFNEALDATCLASGGVYFPDHWFGEVKPDFDPDDEGPLPACNTTTNIYGNGDNYYPGFCWM